MESFYRHNDYPIDLYLINSVKTDRFKRFPKVNVHYHYYAIDSSICENSAYRKHLEEICFKLKVMDACKSEYLLMFDTDTLFLGSIENALKDYRTHLNVVPQKLFDGINIGFFIYKKTNIKLFESFINSCASGKFYYTLEEEFLYAVFKGDITFLDSCYNYSEIFYDPKEPVKMVHFIGNMKPYTLPKINDISGCLIKYFDKYYEFAKTVKGLSEAFKMRLKKSEVYYKMIRKIKNG